MRQKHLETALPAPLTPTGSSDSGAASQVAIQDTQAQVRPASLKQDCRTPLLSDHKRIVSFPFGHSGRARRRGITRGPARTRLRAPHL